ncbi:MAG: DUF3868 domain-containing protein [Bacteroidales bacterium]|nr:DUF3868 domain-containing protein [Bacteroidales bacterium]
MKRITAILILSAAMALTSAAQTIEEISTPAGGNLTRRGEKMLVDIAVDLSGLGVGSNRLVVLTPRMVNGADTVALESMGIYGRRRFFWYQRNEDKVEDAFKDINYKAGETPESHQWSKTLKYQDWMDGAHLELHRQLYGCCNGMLQQDITPLAEYKEIIYVPQFRYVEPPVELEKKRELAGSAYVDFPVSRTEIRPDYRNNRAEIGKILSSLDSLRNDSDITVKSLTIKGFASPESPYKNNERLAKGRTESLKKYVRSQYNFSDDFIRTSYEPEDWKGLRAYVDSCLSLTNREEILAIIDSNMDPDPKETKIKKEYPAEYRFLLENCYPALRHSDYAIEYTIVSYAKPEDIKAVFEKSPGKLSLNELFILSRIYEPGSEEFDDVFEVAVTIYPTSEEANLNAANAAMGRGDLTRAARYLTKAGESAEAEYARGVHAALSKDYVQAKTLFQKAAEGGIMEAGEIAASMDEFIARAGL